MRNITTTPKTTSLLVDMSGMLHTSYQVNLLPKIAQSVKNTPCHGIKMGDAGSGSELKLEE